MNKRKLYYKKIHTWKNPEEVFLRVLRHENNIFWLDSAKAEKGLSRFSYMGKASSLCSFKKKQEDVFSYLQRQLQKNYITSNLPFDFIGGYVGYFGYELQNSMWFFVDKFLAFDHLEKEIYAVYVTANKEKADQWFTDYEERIRKEQSTAANFPSEHTTLNSQTITFKLKRNHKQYRSQLFSCWIYAFSRRRSRRFYVHHQTRHGEDFTQKYCEGGCRSCCSQ